MILESPRGSIEGREDSYTSVCTCIEFLIANNLSCSRIYASASCLETQEAEALNKKSSLFYVPVAIPILHAERYFRDENN